MYRDLNEDQLNQACTVSLPLRTLLRLAEPAQPAALPAGIGKYAILEDCLPIVGSEFKGGIYAGITVDGVTPMALVLLPGDEKKTWADAGKWAAKQGAVLPSRVDALILFQNLKSQFKEDYYWTRDEHAGNADCAWIQGFGGGNQNHDRKSGDYRCRAVRRVAI